MLDLAPNDPGRYGWRFWELTPWGQLAAPYVQPPYVDAAPAGQTIDAKCLHRGCTNIPAPDCNCGVYYMPRVSEMFEHFHFRHFLLPNGPHPSVDWGEGEGVMRRIRDGSSSFALSYGVALGNIETDPNQRQHEGAQRTGSGWKITRLADDTVCRAARFHMLAIMIPAAAVWCAPFLVRRHQCSVFKHVSLDWCRKVEGWFSLSVSDAQLAELAAPRGSVRGTISPELAKLAVKDPAVRAVVLNNLARMLHQRPR